MGYSSSFFIASNARLSELRLVAGGNPYDVCLAALPPESNTSTNGLSWDDVVRLVGHLSGWEDQRVLAGMNVLIDNGNDYEVRELAGDLTLALASGNTSEESADALRQMPDWCGSDTWCYQDDVQRGLQQLNALAVEAATTGTRLFWCCFDTDLLK